MKTNETTYETVRQGYATIALTEAKGCCGSRANHSDPDRLVEHIGYRADEPAALPEGANMGLSCGNPTAIAALKPGEVVLDLGSGGGFDVFIAGRAIGVDMTAEMPAKAPATSRRPVSTT